MPSGVYKRIKYHKLITSKSQKRYWANIADEERVKRGFLVQKQWNNMTEEERRERTRPGIEAMNKITRKNWDCRDKKERMEYMRPCTEAGLKACQTLEAKQKRSKSMKKDWANMTSEAKLERMQNFREAGTKASQKANPSSIEKMIWKELDRLNIEYETQAPFVNGRFIVDIYIPAQRLIIECNGDYYHNYEIFPKQRIRDEALEKYANKKDYKVMWLWESEIRKNPKQALMDGLNQIKLEAF